MARAGHWTPDEDSKLADAVRTCGGKDWYAIPSSCQVGRDFSAVADSATPWAPECLDDWTSGIWTTAENIKFNDAVQTNADKH